jgi:hypothetical protein
MHFVVLVLTVDHLLLKLQQLSGSSANTTAALYILLVLIKLVHCLRARPRPSPGKQHLLLVSAF